MGKHDIDKKKGVNMVAEMNEIKKDIYETPKFDGEEFLRKTKAASDRNFKKLMEGHRSYMDSQKKK